MDIFAISEYIWPLLIIFQVVIAFSAFSRLGGTGPTLMLAGAGVVLLRFGYDWLQKFQGNSLDYSNGLPAEHFVLYGITMLGNILFAVGVLVMINTDPVPDENTLGRVEY